MKRNNEVFATPWEDKIAVHFKTDEDEGWYVMEDEERDKLNNVNDIKILEIEDDPLIIAQLDIEHKLRHGGPLWEQLYMM